MGPGRNLGATVVAEEFQPVSFGFWKNISKKSFDTALWTLHLSRVLPNIVESAYWNRGHVHSE